MSLARTALHGSLLALLLVLGACFDDPIEVRNEADADYGRGELMKALATYAESDRSSGAYRELYRSIREVHDQFDEPMAELADRKLVFLALQPLEASKERPLDEQFRTLALTVWPAIFEQPPKSGETARQYAARLCADPLAVDCGDVVPEFYPLVVNALGWRHLRDRARDALSVCPPCREDPEYRQALETIEARAALVRERASRREDEASPSRWPAADENAAPWPDDVPLFEVDDEGKAEFRGAQVEAGRWRRILKADRRGAEALGVMLAPDQRVRVLLQIVRDATAAGFEEVVLQAREPEHPYRLRAYRIGLGGRGRRDPAVEPRPVDTIQVLVQMLDAALAHGEGPLRL